MAVHGHEKTFVIIPLGVFRLAVCGEPNPFESRLSIKPSPSYYAPESALYLKERSQNLCPFPMCSVLIAFFNITYWNISSTHLLSFVAESGAHRGSLPAYFNVLDDEPQTADQKNQD